MALVSPHVGHSRAQRETPAHRIPLVPAMACELVGSSISTSADDVYTSGKPIESRMASTAMGMARPNSSALRRAMAWM
jgi:hypothetical protein